MTLAVAAFMAAIWDDTFCLFVSSWFCFHFNEACNQVTCQQQSLSTIELPEKIKVKNLRDRFPSRGLVISYRECARPPLRPSDPRWWYWWAPVGVPSTRSSPSAAEPIVHVHEFNANTTQSNSLFHNTSHQVVVCMWHKFEKEKKTRERKEHEYYPCKRKEI